MSCSVQANVGFKRSELWLQKANLVIDIRQVMRARNLTPGRAARIVGMPLPQFRETIKGHFDDIDVNRLVDCLRRLGHDIEIIIKPLPQTPKGPGALTITPSPLPRSA